MPLFSSISAEIDITLELPEHTIFASVNEGAIQDVVLNILFNAKDSIEETACSGSITVLANTILDPDTAEEYLQIIITDTGNGFSSQALQLGSEPFFTTKPRGKERGKGRGLGLAMVQSIARELGGTLELANTPTRGASVTFTVPRLRKQHKPAQSNELDLTSHDLDKKLVLIVDDNAQIRAIIREQVLSMGLLALEASQVEEAQNLIHTLSQICIVISDIDMPGERDGLDLAQFLSIQHPDIGVLLVSGLPAGDRILDRAKRQFCVLAKPLDMAQFESAVNSLVSKQIMSTQIQRLRS